MIEVFVGVLLDKDLNDQLNDHCKENGIKKKYLIAKLIEDFLKQNKDKEVGDK